MKQIKIIIGANFGDEGKGLMTDYFAQKAKEADKKCIVVCSNGGSQRGHTVLTPKGDRHVFHHFGSGVFTGAHTYLPNTYILNPIIFRQEYEELKKMGYEPVVYADRTCMVTTPYDMILNQILEETRKKKKHGSCGMGIYETIHRYDLSAMPFVKPFLEGETKEFLREIKTSYVQSRMKEATVEIPEHWKDILDDEGIIDAFMEDCKFMKSHLIFQETEFLKGYDSILFENGQGLLLDQNNAYYYPHLTPSNTGIKNPADIINEVFQYEECDIEACYVTRTYMTRHGAGRFDSECKKEELNPDMQDLTNVPNPHQDSLRYGHLDLEHLLKRIYYDVIGFSGERNIKTSIAVTHVNEYDLPNKHDIKRIYQWKTPPFNGSLYFSDGETRNSVSALH